MRLNYRIVWKENLQHKKNYFPKMRLKRFFNLFHTIRLFYRIRFSKNRENLQNAIRDKKPHWIKGE